MMCSRCLVSCLLLAMALGCRDTTQLRLYPVSGRVLVNGKPAAGAELAFYGTDEHLQTAEAPFPRATVQDDGSFTLHSSDAGEGAPAGHYQVTVVWRRSSSADPEVRDAAPDMLRGRYATPESSTITVEVKPAENILPDIEIK